MVAYDENANLVGKVEGGIFKSTNAETIIRIDGGELYSKPAMWKHLPLRLSQAEIMIGLYENGVATNLEGKIIFTTKVHKQ
ncbi:hypothetical protein [Vreelandella profundi]|uniref:hypothetical protein n=1 Tax=Vreelandella profundi TaxID=2852117 RepID=UPI001F4646EB|nr:hypothetical protein [Halomonas profundi]